MASGSTGNATKISDGETSLLLDAGITIKEIEKRTGFTLSSVSGCFTTHEHADHSKAIKALAKRGIDIYASTGTFNALGLTGHRFHILKPFDIVIAGTFRVMAFDVRHDAAEPLGFLIESMIAGSNSNKGDKLVYFSDTAFVKYKFIGLTHIIAECNHGDIKLRQSVRDGSIAPELAARITKNHMSIERLVEFLNANDLSRLKAVYLIHLSDNNSNADEFRQIVQRITGTEVYVF